MTIESQGNTRYPSEAGLDNANSVYNQETNSSLSRHDPVGLGIRPDSQFHSVSSTTDRDLLQFSSSEQDDTLRNSKQSSMLLLSSDNSNTLIDQTITSVNEKCGSGDSSVKESPPLRESSLNNGNSSMNWPDLGEEDEELLTSVKMPDTLFDNLGKSNKNKFMLTLSPDMLKLEIDQAELELAKETELVQTSHAEDISDAELEKNVRINSKAEIIEDLVQGSSEFGSLTEGNRVVEFQNGKFSQYMDRSLLSDDEQSSGSHKYQIDEVPNQNSLLPSDSVKLPLLNDNTKDDSDLTGSTSCSLSRADSQDSAPEDSAPDNIGHSDAVDDLISRYKKLKMNTMIHESGIQSLPTQLEHGTLDKVTVNRHISSAPEPVLGEKYLQKSPSCPSSKQRSKLALDDDLFNAEDDVLNTPTKNTGM